MVLATKTLRVPTAPAVEATTCAGTLQSSVALAADSTATSKPNAALTHLRLLKSALCQSAAPNLVSVARPMSSANGQTIKIRIIRHAIPSMAAVAPWTGHIVAVAVVSLNVPLAITRPGQTHAKPAPSLQKISTLMASRISTSPSVSSTLLASR